MQKHWQQLQGRFLHITCNQYPSIDRDTDTAANEINGKCNKTRTGKVKHDLRSSGVVVQVLGDIVHLLATCYAHRNEMEERYSQETDSRRRQSKTQKLTSAIVSDDQPARLLVVVL